VAVVAAAGVLGLAACSGGERADDDAASATFPAAAPAATNAPAGREDAGFGVVGGAGEPESVGDAGGALDNRSAPLGQQLAIEAHARMQTADVRAAVERITTTVATRGGRVASADIDYTPAAEEDDGDAASSRATLVVAVPPGELSAVRNLLDETGDVLSYDQLAEDVTDQLADLDTRIANQRASIERIRELYGNAVDVDAVVRIEAELTNRETLLEQLLAAQQHVTDRVAMSTLTIDITTAPATGVDAADDGDTGVGDALAAGWSAFAGAAFAIVLALAAAMPFVLALLVVALVGVWVRHLLRRGTTTPAPSPTDDVTTEREPVSASRPE
jgi:hypothetical protein